MTRAHHQGQLLGDLGLQGPQHALDGCQLLLRRQLLLPQQQPCCFKGVQAIIDA